MIIKGGGAGNTCLAPCLDNTSTVISVKHCLARHEERARHAALAGKLQVQSLAPDRLLHILRYEGVESLDKLGRCIVPHLSDFNVSETVHQNGGETTDVSGQQGSQIQVLVVCVVVKQIPVGRENT